MKLVAWMSFALVMSLFLFTRAIELANHQESGLEKEANYASLNTWVIGITSLFLVVFTVLLWYLDHPIE